MVDKNIIGIHLYKISVIKNREPEPLPVETVLNDQNLQGHTDDFLQKHSISTSSDQNLSQNWYFDPKPNNQNTRHGTIMYGSTGFESDLYDSRTRELNYKRQVSDIETIPLYYRFWIPESGPYGLMALQTHGLRSCVGRIQQAFARHFRENNEGYHLNFSAIVPNSVEVYKNHQVKTISLVKREMSSDSAENQLGKFPDLVDVDLTISATPRKNLGLLGTLIGRMRGAENKSLVYNEIVFDEATAEVLVGGRRKKVSLIGVTENAGKIDVTNDIEMQPNGHPKFDSISKEVETLFKNVVVS